MDAVRTTNWREIGRIVHVMHSLAIEASEALSRGETDPDARHAWAEEYNALISQFSRGFWEFPTFSSFGALAHPFILLNMLAEHLLLAGVPLNDEQTAALAQLGEEYDRRWEILQASYLADTLALRKVMDEVDLKEWFRVEMLKVLTPEQRAVAVPPGLEGRTSLDPYSPAAFLAKAARLVKPGPDGGYAEALLTRTRENLDAGDDAFDAAGFVFQAWADELATIPLRAGMDLAFRPTPELIQAGKAQLRAYEQLYAHWAPTDELRRALMRNYYFLFLVPALPEED
jgi:hypothetical protein